MRRSSSGKSGQSLVEVALTLPVLLILFLGIAETGYWLFAHVQVSNAARAGAREGSLCRMLGTCGNLSTDIETAVFQEAQYLNLNTGNTTVTTTTSGTNPTAVGAIFTVTVNHNHTPLFVSDFIPMFPSPLPVRKSVTMRFSN
jgi:Flp pilus assembly protein TadG